MNYRELYLDLEEKLDSAFEARQIFTHATNKYVMNLSFLGDKPVPPREETVAQSLCTRRMSGEPLQYLLGKWEFYGLTFRVGKGVLIPRQDTETLVDVALGKVANTERPEILDLCSGTGCVAIAIEQHHIDARVTALEVSEEAFPYLRENVMINDSTVKPILGDLLNYIHPQPLDLLVANPPYIPRDVIATLQKEVRHEPRRALDGGVDGLDFYRAIIRRYRPQMKEGGWMCMEIGVGQSDKVRALLAEEGFIDITVQDDYTGVPRVVSARRPVETP